MSDVKSIILKAKSENRWLLEPEAMNVLKEYDIPTLKFITVKTIMEAEDASIRIGYPVVMKIVSPDIIHKTDAGCVKLDIKNGSEARQAFVEIMESAAKFKENVRIEGVIVYPYVPKGVEVIVGVTDDAQFGRTLMFGLGGIWVEILKDVSFRVVPITGEDAMGMIKDIKGYPLLKEARGGRAKDIDAVADVIMKVSRLCSDYPEIKELDLNPIYVYEKGIKVVDARILTR